MTLYQTSSGSWLSTRRSKAIEKPRPMSVAILPDCHCEIFKNHRCHNYRPLPQRKMATMHEHDGQNNTVSAFSQQA